MTRLLCWVAIAVLPLLLVVFIPGHGNADEPSTKPSEVKQLATALQWALGDKFDDSQVEQLLSAFGRSLSGTFIGKSGEEELARKYKNRLANDVILLIANEEVKMQTEKVMEKKKAADEEYQAQLKALQTEMDEINKKRTARVEALRKQFGVQ